MFITTSLRNLSDSILVRYDLFSIIAKEIESLSNKLNRKIRVADFGAGTAHYWFNDKLSEILENHIYELYLIDATPELIVGVNNSQAKVIQHSGFIPAVMNDFEENYFDLTIALDLIEHLNFESAMLFLYEIDRATSSTSIIFTPNGMVWQPPSENNPFNAHISFYKPKFLKKLGWVKIHGVTGLKINHGPYGSLKKELNLFRFIRNVLLLPVVSRFPNLAFSFVAIKSQKNPRIKVHE
jgi:hypothetical protein